eukprot:364492-Chlamydomonas_euryale.AAC.2
MVRTMRELGAARALAAALRLVNVEHPACGKAVSSVLKPLEVLTRGCGHWASSRTQHGGGGGGGGSRGPQAAQPGAVPGTDRGDGDSDGMRARRRQRSAMMSMLEGFEEVSGRVSWRAVVQGVERGELEVERGELEVASARPTNLRGVVVEARDAPHAV